MLEILSETKDPLRVQPHLKKCFEGIASLEFDDDYVIRAMISPQGERVAFLTPVRTADARGSVELWLLQVEEAMVSSVRHVIQHSLRVSVSSTRHHWVENVPGQAVLCAAQVLWTAGITRAISQGMPSLKRYAQDLQVHHFSFAVSFMAPSFIHSLLLLLLLLLLSLLGKLQDF